MRLIASFLATTLFFAFTSSASALELTIELSGLENREGTVLYAVFADEQSFLNGADRAIESGFLQLATVGDVAEIAIPLNPGQYAVAVIHDQNANGELDVGAFGIPVEGYGFSNNPDTTLGPPSFVDSQFLLSEENQITRIHIKY